MSTPRTSARTGGAGAVARTPTTDGQQRLQSIAPSSAGTASNHFRTPTTATNAAGRRTPGTAGGGRQSATQTPHARAARLALETRRTAMFTPGGRQSRRKSGRMLRDSPRDLLRNLSRRLAPTSKAVSTSSSPASGSSGSSGNSVGASQPRRSRRSLASNAQQNESGMDTIHEGRAANGAANSASRRRSYLDIDDDDDSDSLPLDRPRLSLPINDDDNDDDLQPHRSTILEGDADLSIDADADLANFTMRSIELARRTATQEQLLQARRFSRGSLGGGRSSFGSVRMSDYIDGFLGTVDEDAEDERIQSDFFPEGAFDDLAAAANESSGAANDQTFERLDSETGDRQDALAAGRESGVFGVVDVPLDGNETTFVMGGQQSPERASAAAALAGGEDDQDLDVSLQPPELVDDMDVEAGPMFDDYDDDRDRGDANIWMAGDEDEEAVEEVAGGEQSNAVSGAKDAQPALRSANVKGPRGKRLKLSAHGIPYPSLPAGVVKRVAQTFAQANGSGTKTKLSQETVAALSTASDWFFEQVGVDLQRYAKHAGRKTIDESDMLLLMRRQRQVNATVTPFSLAQRLLPRELLQEIRMVPDAPMLKGRRQQRKAPASRISTGSTRVGRKAGR